MTFLVPGTSAYTVDFATPVIRRIVLDQKVRMCGTTAVIDGCTAFAEETLSCHCEQAGEAWQLSAVAHTAPRIYLFTADPATLAHELRHIEDIRSGLEGRMASLTSRRFQSESDCTHAGERAAEAFGQEMNALRSQSQERYQ